GSTGCSGHYDHCLWRCGHQAQGAGERRGCAFYKTYRFWDASQRNQHAGRTSCLTAVSAFKGRTFESSRARQLLCAEGGPGERSLTLSGHGAATKSCIELSIVVNGPGATCSDAVKAGGLGKGSGRVDLRLAKRR